MIDEKKLIEDITDVEVAWYLDGNYTTYDSTTIMEIIEEQPKVGEWISVEKELPKEKGYYLVTRKGHTCAEVRQFRGKKWAVDTQHFGEVIAWQPLPKPYKGD